jgi:hypothetical protein
MKEYESVSIRLVQFEQQDVVTTSGTVFDDETIYEVPSWWGANLKGGFVG